MAQKRENYDPVESEAPVPKMGSFDDRDPNHYDVILNIGDHMFFALKGHLAQHSPVLDRLFFGENADKNQKEFTLEEMDAKSFEGFLGTINGDECLDDTNIEGVLKLAHALSASTALKKCHSYVLNESKLSPKKKFDISMVYDYEDLKEKALKEVKTSSELLSITSDDISRFDEKTKDMLLIQSLRVHTNHLVEEADRRSERAENEQEDAVMLGRFILLDRRLEHAFREVFNGRRFGPVQLPLPDDVPPPAEEALAQNRQAERRFRNALGIIRRRD